MIHYLYAILHKRMSRRRFLSGVATLAGALAAACAGGGKNSKKVDSYRNATPYDAEEGNPTPATVLIRRWFGPVGAEAKVQWDGGLQTLGATTPTKVVTAVPELNPMAHGAGWAADVERAYFVVQNIPRDHYFALIRFDPATNGYSTYTSDRDDGYCFGRDLTVYGGKVYVVHHGPTVGGLSAMYVSVFSTTSDPPACLGTYCYSGYSSGPAGTIATDGSYLLVGGEGGVIALIDMSDMSLVDTENLGSHLIHATEYDAATSKWYVAAPDNYVWKVSRSGTSLSKDAEYHLTDVSGSITDDLAVSETDLWLGMETGSDGVLVKVPLAGFSSHTVVECGDGLGSSQGVFVDTDGDHLWALWEAGDSPNPGRITRLAFSDESLVNVWLANDEFIPNEFVQYASGGYLISTRSGTRKVINLRNLLSESSLKKPTSGNNYSYWVSLRAFADTTPGVSVGTLKTYTGGANGLGTGWTAIGGVATDYTEPTGTEDVSGTELSVANYPTLEALDADIFAWTSGSPKVIDGSLANPNTGDIGTAGTDYCFLVIQLVASSAVADGLSNGEVLTIASEEGSVTTTTTAAVQGRASV